MLNTGIMIKDRVIELLSCITINHKCYAYHYAKYFQVIAINTIFECNPKIMTKNIKCDISIFHEGAIKLLSCFRDDDIKKFL